jgi:hypothetical protein
VEQGAAIFAGPRVNDTETRQAIDELAVDVDPDRQSLQAAVELECLADHSQRIAG